MRHLIQTLCWLSVAAALTAVSSGQRQFSDEEKSPKLKQEQLERLLKEDHKKSLEDASELVKLSEELKIELEKTDRHVLSVTALKKTEEIEKLAKRIRSRMRRY
ncbi:MAG: hypothetical protein JJE04_14265 [Acidobacteriia bacterium]|nr:hypothetical protein [Terriglobia bacterium]